MGRACDYSDVTASPTPEDFQYLRQKVQELEERLHSRSRSRNPSVPPSVTIPDDIGIGIAVSSNTTSNPYAPLLFLDSDAYDFGRFAIPKPRVLAPPETMDALGDITEVQMMVETYFLTAHTWMPIISKKRLYQQLMKPLIEQNADFALLYLCMKLIIQRPPEPPTTVQTPLYAIAKRLYFMVETSGVYSVALLQAGILISLYELGHAIYPAAYLSIGQCARLGHALGIHGNDVPQMLPKVGTWTEQEERRRVWWAVIILERYVNLGSKGHPLATEDASRETCLPANDSMWDNGDMATNEPLLVSSSANAQAGNFARLAQASHLLGRVIRHTNDLPTDVEFRLEEARQIDRTIRALYKLLPGKGSDDSIGSCTPLAVCFSAIMTLYDPYTCQSAGQTPEQLSHTAEAVQGLKGVSEEVVRLAHDKLAAIELGLDQTSPLILDCMYQALANYAWLVRETGKAEFVEKARILRRLFEVAGKRWRVAVEYVKILEATEVELAGL